ncbi:hypothetical protein G7K_3354-t1 [Saitoella complicata NRRL Y-17804]|uniref:Uncharacterized protein n=1 Tax=Saitoella complicata (strain BCRC 22490 / CBS 7301 / JCM 7358 / NBRC 10748 / NRRL Y-17804) TaxID=698492 RepID=A0A0E9NHM6_SAICN|nr:hypothetical protein G7K_3354-t1 [Saitoella complicata NRRL Y-17804]
MQVENCRSPANSEISHRRRIDLASSFSTSIARGSSAAFFVPGSNQVNTGCGRQSADHLLRGYVWCRAPVPATVNSRSRCVQPPSRSQPAPDLSLQGPTLNL